MPTRSADCMFTAIQQLMNAIPRKAFKTFTSNRGKEFACFRAVEELGVDFYFSDAYSSWQRGSNENSNGLLREYYPKGTDFALVTNENLFSSLDELNSRPRKVLGFTTPYEAFQVELEKAMQVSH